MEKIGLSLFFFGVLASLAVWVASKGYIVSIPEGATPAWVILALLWITFTGTTITAAYGGRKSRITEKRGWVLLYVGFCSVVVVLLSVVYKFGEPLRWPVVIFAALTIGIGGILITKAILKGFKEQLTKQSSHD